MGQSDLELAGPIGDVFVGFATKPASDSIPPDMQTMYAILPHACRHKYNFLYDSMYILYIQMGVY
jgi:hypothetical protein